jgi:hypothetical protein
MTGEVMYYLTITQCVESLKQLEIWLQKAESHAIRKKFDISVLMNARLAPDQHHFIKQIQSACDYVKGAAARLSGEPLPKHPDIEKTIGDLRERVQKTIDFVLSVSESRYADADECEVTLPWAPRNPVTARKYLLQITIPNTYFHLTTAYSILRHNGVDLGKLDFMGEIYAKRS